MNIRVNLTNPRRELVGDERLRTQTSIDHDDWICDDAVIQPSGALSIVRSDTIVAAYSPTGWARLVRTEDDFETVIAP